MVLTRCTPLHFLGSRRKDIQDLDRNLHHFIGHLRGQRDTSINLEPSEETFNASEDVDEDFLALRNIFSRLWGFNSSREPPLSSKRGDSPKVGRPRQQRLFWRVGMPKKIDMNVLTTHGGKEESIITRLTPSPSVSEKAQRTLRVGTSHLFNLSSLPV